MLSIDELIIIYINLNNQINKRVIHIVSYYSFINWIVFKLINFDTIIIELTSVIVYLYIDINT